MYSHLSRDLCWCDGLPIRDVYDTLIVKTIKSHNLSKRLFNPEYLYYHYGTHNRCEQAIRLLADYPLKDFVSEKQSSDNNNSADILHDLVKNFIHTNSAISFSSAAKWTHYFTSILTSIVVTRTGHAVENVVAVANVVACVTSMLADSISKAAVIEMIENFTTLLRTEVVDPIVEEQSGLSTILLVRKVLTAVVVTIGLVVCGGNVSSMKYVVLLNSYRKAIREMWSDSENFIEGLCVDILGFDFSGESDYIDLISGAIADCDRHLDYPPATYGEDGNKWYDLSDLQKRLIEIRRRSKDFKTTATRSLLTVLMNRESRLLSHKSACQTVVAASTTRVDPVVLLVRGAAGVGKTTWVENFLIPQIAKRVGLSPRAYNMKWSKDTKYWQEYANQSFFVFDEAFAQGQNDPLVGLLNSVCSSAFFNMEGAALEHKFQPCQAKFVICITNSENSIPLSSVLTTEAAHAFWSRFTGYTVTFPGYDVSRRRNDQNRFDDWSHLRFSKETWTMHDTSGGYKITHKFSVTQEDIVRACVDDYEKAVANHQRTKANRQEALLGCSQVSYPPGPIELQSGTTPFVAHVSGPPGAGKTYFVTSLSKYFASLFKLSSVIITPTTIPRTTAFQKAIYVLDDFLPEHDKKYKSIIDSVPYGSLILVTSNMDLRKKRTLPLVGTYYTDVSFTEIGLARRVGATGKIRYTNPVSQQVTWIDVSEHMGIYGYMDDITTIQYDGMSYTTVQFKEKVYDNFVGYLKKGRDLIKIHGPVSQAGDIEVWFSSTDKAIRTIKSKLLMANLLARPCDDAGLTLKNPNVTSTIDTRTFLIPSDIENVTSENDFVETMITKFRMHTSGATLRVTIGDNSYYYDGRGILTMSITDSKVTYSVTGTDFVFREDDNEFRLSAADVVDVVLGRAAESGIPLQVAELVRSHENTISQHPLVAVKIAQVDCRMRQLQRIQSGTTEAVSFAMKHPLKSLFVCSFGVLGLVAVGKCLYNYFMDTTPSVSKTVSEINSEMQSYDPASKKRFYDEAGRRKMTDAERTKLLRMRLAFDRDLADPITDKEITGLREIAEMQSLIDHNDLVAPYSSVINLFSKNMVVVRTPYSVSYGLAIREKYIFTVSHLFDGFTNYDGVYIEDDRSGSTKCYGVKLVARDTTADVAMLTVTDRTCPNFKDITSHVATQDEARVFQNGFLYKTSGSTSSYYFTSFSPVSEAVNTGSVLQYNVLYYDCSDCPTVRGDCGLPYFTLVDGTKPKLIGLHSAVYKNSRKGIASAIDSLSLDVFLKQETLEIQSNEVIGKSNVLDLKTTRVLDVVFGADTVYLNNNIIKDPDPIDVPYHYEGISPIWTVPYIRSLQNKDKYEKTPWNHDIPGFTNTLLNTPRKLDQVTDTSELVEFANRKSIELTQILKFTKRPVNFDEIAYRKALSDVTDYMIDTYSTYNDKGCHRIVSWSEAINGINNRDPLFPFSESMNLNATAGGVWKTVFNINNKRQLFEGEFPTVDFAKSAAGVALKQEVNSAWSYLNHGVRPLTVSVDVMKAELQDSSKTKKGLTRLFSVADTVEILIQRRVFSTLLAVMKAKHETSVLKIGIDPIGGMDLVYKQLKSFSPYGFTFDYKRYDKYLPRRVILDSMDILHKVFTDSPNSSLRPLFHICGDMIARGMHWFKGTVYMRRQGHNSGSAITTMVNCVTNLVLAGYAYHRMRQLKFGDVANNSFLNDVCPVIHGDDITVAIHPRITDWFTSSLFSEAVADFGMTPHPTFDTPVPIEQLTFLSRSFEGSETVLLPRIKKSSFERFIYWTTSKAPDQIGENLSLFLDEACFYDEDYFNMAYDLVKNLIVERFSPLTIRFIDMRPYHMRRNSFANSIMSKSDIIRARLSNFPHCRAVTLNQLERSISQQYNSAAGISSTSIQPYVERCIELQIGKPNERIMHEFETVETGFEYQTLGPHAKSNEDTTLYKTKKMETSLAAKNNETASMANPTTTTERRQPPMEAAQVITGASQIQRTVPADAVSYNVAVTQSAGDEEIPVIDNIFSPPPADITHGGIMTNIYGAAYNTYMKVSDYTVDSTVGEGTLIFSLRYGASSLNALAKAYVDLHGRYDGPIDYRVHITGNAALTGEIIVGIVPDATKTSYTVEYIQQFGMWETMAMNKVGNAYFVLRDQRKTGFYRGITEQGNSGIVALVYVPLTNPYGTTGSNITINVLNKLNSMFVCTAPNVAIAPAVTTLDDPKSPVRTLENVRISRWFGDDWYLLTDGYDIEPNPISAKGQQLSKSFYTNPREILVDDTFNGYEHHFRSWTVNSTTVYPYERFPRVIYDASNRCVTLPHSGHCIYRVQSSDAMNNNIIIFNGMSNRTNDFSTRLYFFTGNDGDVTFPNAPYPLQSKETPALNVGYKTVESVMLSTHYTRFDLEFNDRSGNNEPTIYFNFNRGFGADNSLGDNKIVYRGYVMYDDDGTEFEMKFMILRPEIFDEINTWITDNPTYTSFKYNKALADLVVSGYSQFTRDFTNELNIASIRYYNAGGGEKLPDQWVNARFGSVVPLLLATPLSGIRTMSTSQEMYHFRKVLSTVFYELADSPDASYLDFDIYYDFSSTPIARLRFNPTIGLSINLGSYPGVTFVRGYDSFIGSRTSRMYIKNVRISPLNSSLLQTSTSNWVQRTPTAWTIPDSASYQPYVSVKKHKIEKQAFMLAGAASGATSGIFGAMATNKQYEHELEMQQNAFDQQMKMQRVSVANQQVLQRRDLSNQRYMQQQSFQQEQDMMRYSTNAQFAAMGYSAPTYAEVNHEQTVTNTTIEGATESSTSF